MLSISKQRDTYIAIFLLLFSGAMFWSSSQIRDLGFQGLMPQTWPQFLLAVITGLSLLYLFRTLTVGVASAKADNTSTHSWKTYKRPVICFVTFFAFLVSLDYLGMLIGGILFVFILLTILGEKTLRVMLIHSLIALLSVGIMWSIFTYVLKVFLPEGLIGPGR